MLGQLVTGQFLAIECKREREAPTEEQAAFLAQVERANGLAILARSIADVQRGLDAFFGETRANVQELPATAITPGFQSPRGTRG